MVGGIGQGQVIQYYLIQVSGDEVRYFKQTSNCIESLVWACTSNYSSSKKVNYFAMFILFFIGKITMISMTHFY